MTDNDCGCRVERRDGAGFPLVFLGDKVVRCPLHAAAPQMLGALVCIVQQCRETARDGALEGAECRAWRSIAAMAEAALAEVGK
mgnify:CR=1 FL=1